MIYKCFVFAGFYVGTTLINVIQMVCWEAIVVVWNDMFILLVWSLIGMIGGARYINHWEAYLWIKLFSKHSPSLPDDFDRMLILAIVKLLIIVRGPGAEPGKWVQSFFLNVFILYRYCTLWNRMMAFSQHWAFLNNAFYIFSPIAVQNSGFSWSGKTENPCIYSYNW